jgi:hypothetical protein
MKQILWYNRKCYKKARWKRKIDRMIISYIKEWYPEEEREEKYDEFITRIRSRIGTSGYYYARYN